MAAAGALRSGGAGSPSGGDAKYRELLDRLAETVFEFDVEGRLVYVNHASFEIFGYTPEDFAHGHLSVYDMVVPEEHDRLRANIGRRLEQGATEGFQYTARRKDGSTFPALVQTIVVTCDGRPVGVQGYLIDISRRVAIEGALRQRIDFEKLIMRVSTRLVAESGARELDACIDEALAEIGRFTAVDRSYVFLLSGDGTWMDNTHEWVAEGISAERRRLQHVPTTAGFPWFMHELAQQHVVLIPHVTKLPLEAVAERREFTRQNIQSMVCVAMIQGGHLSGFLGLDAVRCQRLWSDDEIALLRIIGEILMGAIVRRRSEVALQESERKYRALVETTGTGFVILDDRGRVLDANAEYVRVTGQGSLDRIRGRSVVEWTAAHDQARNVEAVATCLRNGSVRDLQIDYAHGDGSIVPVLISATVTRVEGERRIVTLIRDLSDRIRLEAELRRSEKLHSVGVLAGGIAHDFNNILTAILGNVSLLQATFGKAGEAGTHLQEIERASFRARELTRQLLTFSHGGEPIRKLFVAADLVRESVALALRGRATACDLRIAPGLPPVNGDEGQIGQVIRNLVINASQAMGGGGTVVVSAETRSLRDREVHLLAAGGYVVISVVDGGVGIRDEHLPHIFDPYFTTKRDGRGLGLAVSHSIVTGHRGAITVASQPGHGSTFTVYLPAAPADLASLAPAAPPIVRGRGRVLIMDDEESVRQVARNIVQLLGYEVELAREGGEAIEAWQRARDAGTPFDVAIMDLTVPGGLGGRDATRELLAIDPEAKVVVSSGYSDDPVMANYRDHGFREVLAKPYEVADVGRVLAALLGHR